MAKKDAARTYTDAQLAKMEREINKIYKTAYGEISEKWNAYMKSHEKTLDAAYENLQKATASGDKDAIAKAREEYDRTAKNITVNNDRYRKMVDETAQRMTNANEVALSYVNGEMPKIYTANYNEFGSEPISGYSFSLVNESAVKNLIKTDKSLLPQKKIDIPKDVQWNVKKINSQILQGILQGESIPKMASRLMTVTDMNREAAIRNARTMTTGAENKGRQDSFEKAQSDGVIMKRIWVATNDDRTRAWHADLNGVEVEIDEPWENDHGEIMYPGDPDADPANVYNCRCSIRAVVKGFNWNQSSEEEAGDIRDQFSDYSFKQLFKEMENSEGTEGNDLWNTLRGDGYTATENWEKYLKGELPDDQAQKVDDILQQYLDSKNAESDEKPEMESTGEENDRIKDALDSVSELKATDADHDWEPYDDKNSESAVNPLLNGEEVNWDVHEKITDKIDEIEDKLGKSHDLLDVSEVKTFEIKDLTTVQPYVEREPLVNYINKIGSGEVDVKSEYGVGSILVVKQDDQLYVFDGNHRVSAAYLLDEKTITANYIDLDNSEKLNEAIAQINGTSDQGDVVTVRHYTSEENVDRIMDEGFDLSKSGTGAGSTWGDGVYFLEEGSNEELFYKYRLDTDSYIESDVDTSGMLNVDTLSLNGEAYGSINKMYSDASKSLPEEYQKEFRKYSKSMSKEDAFVKVANEHYTGLVINQTLTGGAIDPLVGGNQIVVFDKDAIIKKRRKK